jgi:hypothetical protein
VCFCSVAGNIIPNGTLYAQPGDSASIQCITCNQQCADVALTLNFSLPIYPPEGGTFHKCLDSPPPANTWTTLLDFSGPILFHAPTQYCCDLGPAHCTDGTPCASPLDCPDSGCNGSGSACFEYTVGSADEGRCAAMGGTPRATYCGNYGCGID